MIYQFDYQIWQAGASPGFDSNETNQAGAGDVITSRSRGKLKILYLHYQSVSKLGMMITCLDGLLPVKSLDPLIRWYSEITWQTTISPLSECLWPPNLTG